VVDDLPALLLYVLDLLRSLLQCVLVVVEILKASDFMVIYSHIIPIPLTERNHGESARHSLNSSGFRTIVAEN